MPSEYAPPALTEEERFRKLLEETAVKREKASRQEEGFLLPERVEMRQISWKEKITDNSILLFALFVAAGCILYRLQDRNLKKKLEQREEQLLLSYPEFISKLALLMGAGLPIRSAFQRMAADYQNRKTRNQELIYVYEELTLGLPGNGERNNGSTGLRTFWAEMPPDSVQKMCRAAFPES